MLLLSTTSEIENSTVIQKPFSTDTFSLFLFFYHDITINQTPTRFATDANKHRKTLIIKNISRNLHE